MGIEEIIIYIFGIGGMIAVGFIAIIIISSWKEDWKRRKLKKKVGDKIIVNDISTNFEFEIVGEQEFNTIPVNLVVEEDGEINWYLNVSDSDTIIKSVYVVIPKTAKDEEVKEIIEAIYKSVEGGEHES